MKTQKKSARIVLPLLLFATISGLGGYIGEALATDIIITGQFNFRDDRSPNPAGLLPGDILSFGATSITPSGPATTVQATQGATTIGLLFNPSTSFPDLYSSVISFDPLLIGAWTITATDAAGPVSGSTNAIAHPEFIPLVNNLQVGGALLTPHISWTLPDLSGLGVNRILVRVRDLDHFLNGFADLFFTSVNLAPTATSFDIPTGVLAPGKHYSFDILVDNLVTPSVGPTFVQNRSETFTGVYATPEPSTLLLLGSGLAGLAGLTWRRHRRK